MAVVKRIDHVAVLVDDLEKTLAFWRDGLGIQMSHLEDVAAEKSMVAFLPVGTSEIELVKPTTDDSGLSRYLEKRGPGMHHICLEVDDIEGMLENLKQHGVQLINETPVTGSGGKRYAFIHPKSANGVMVELYELPA
ncbi:MAG: methylmalonyl-CoA epimerase [Anaerolineales bacterium]|nr:methylmalonyl-CoA epimerase [Anaerolineales bacterium]